MEGKKVKKRREKEEATAFVQERKESFGCREGKNESEIESGRIKEIERMRNQDRKRGKNEGVKKKGK